MKKKYSVSDEYGLRLDDNPGVKLYLMTNENVADLSDILRTKFKHLDVAWTLEMQTKR